MKLSESLRSSIVFLCSLKRWSSSFLVPETLSPWLLHISLRNDAFKINRYLPRCTTICSSLIHCLFVSLASTHIHDVSPNLLRKLIKHGFYRRFHRRFHKVLHCELHEILLNTVDYFHRYNLSAASREVLPASYFTAVRSEVRG